MRAWFLIFIGVLAVGLLVTGTGSPRLSADPDECPELGTDYELQCHSESSECGSFCFYADCLDCEDASHQDHGSHDHECCCKEDDDGNESCKSWSHQDHGFHSYEISPCIRWYWNLHDPDHGRDVGTDVSNPPSLADSLEFGMVPEDYVPPKPECVPDVGAPEIYDEVSEVVRPTTSVFKLKSEVKGVPVGAAAGDLSHLPNTPAQPGDPTLSPVEKTGDRTVRLTVVGGVNTQYRYWSYNGIRTESRRLEDHDDPDNLPAGWTAGADGWTIGPHEASPLLLRLPFRDLTGVITVDDVRGIVSFQVRSVDDGGVPSGISNIEYAMIDLEGLRSISLPPTPSAVLEFELPLPTPPPWGTPQPTSEDPAVTLPPRPSIASVEQVREAENTVEVTLGGSYPGYTVEYRFWDHSGFRPWDVLDLWKPSGVTSGSFRVTGVQTDTPVSEDGTPLPSFLDFQLRLVNADGLAGDSSDVVVQVWGGDDCTSWKPPAIEDLPPLVPSSSGLRPATPVPPEYTSTFNPACVSAVSDQDEVALSNDCAAMLGFKRFLSGGATTLNWSQDKAIRSWTGVTVSGTPPRVTAIKLRNKGLKGRIPGTISSLKRLTVLDLAGNSLKGEVPPEIGRLTRLETLNLRVNDLTGILPALDTLRRLKVLRLDYNDFSGGLGGRLGYWAVPTPKPPPPSPTPPPPARKTQRYYGITSLEMLTAMYNDLEGDFPVATLLKNSKLETLYLRGNSWTHCYPSKMVSRIDKNDVLQLGLPLCHSEAY